MGTIAVEDAPTKHQDVVEQLLEDAPPVRWSQTTAYRKWHGAHWRLVSLVELGERDDPRMVDVLDRVLSWLLSPGHLRGVQVFDGCARRCASQEGNALFVASRIGQAEAASELARNLIAWQWPDGGWNCDRRPGTTHSSFNETVCRCADWPPTATPRVMGQRGPRLRPLGSSCCATGCSARRAPVRSSISSG